jgi:hypothetical protein
MRLLLLLASALFAFTQCHRTHNPTFVFDPKATPPAPDYSKPECWAALPQRVDLADRTPIYPGVRDEQAEAEVDVFFLHPTSLLGGKKGEDVWNADVRDQRLNDATDKSPILYQATAFNGAGKVYAPRYRQAHYYGFFTKDKASSQQAWKVAHEDVVAAFKYYLANYNQGRPFIIASHSQGAGHAIQLIQEEIEGKALQNQLVVAYLLGWPVEKNKFKKLKPCTTPTETGCFCSWRTFERKYGLKNAKADSVLVTNPIDWTIGDGHHVPKEASKGTVLYKFEKVLPGISDAEACRGILLCTKPKFKGSILFRRKNYHAGDINLYYMDVRNNAQLRAKTYLNKH